MNVLRLYLDPAEIGPDGYPFAWHRGDPAVKHLVRELAGHRCVRCGHPFVVGQSSMMVPHPLGDVRILDGEPVMVNVSRCDDRCRHGGPVRYYSTRGGWGYYEGPDETIAEEVYALWRILTVHHLNGVKHDCRWWNLAALCQRCHLLIQAKVHMLRPYHREHSDWFRLYVAGFYASHYLGEELDRDETMLRLDELLALEHRQLALGDVGIAGQGRGRA